MPQALPSTPAPGGVTIVSATGGPPGGSASVVAQAPPPAQCSIAYRTPAGTMSQAEGLGPSIADASGRVEWTWAIGTGSRTGTGNVTVRCEPGGAATVSITIGQQLSYRLIAAGDPTG